MQATNFFCSVVLVTPPDIKERRILKTTRKDKPLKNIRPPQRTRLAATLTKENQLTRPTRASSASPVILLFR